MEKKNNPSTIFSVNLVENKKIFNYCFLNGDVILPRTCAIFGICERAKKTQIFIIYSYLLKTSEKNGTSIKLIFIANSINETFTCIKYF